MLRRAHSIIGNTSACAEKRAPISGAIHSPWKYLRVRGEETATAIGTPLAMEIPPRARRRVAHHGAAPWRPGNTSACAEKRQPSTEHSAVLRKYLRVRGEESTMAGSSGARAEIPPRARRRVIPKLWAPELIGNTSACAEKSAKPPRNFRRARKYLRVRGEKRPLSRPGRGTVEIPPRARRRVLDRWDC